MSAAIKAIKRMADGAASDALDAVVLAQAIASAAATRNEIAANEIDELEAHAQRIVHAVIGIRGALADVTKAPKQ